MRGRLVRLFKRGAIAVTVGVSLAAVLIAATPQGRTSVRASLLAVQLLPDFPVKPQSWFAEEPSRSRISYRLPGGHGTADLYEPVGDGRHAAVLLFLGVDPAGAEDERVVNLASGLARAGMVVMIPWSARMTEKRIAVEEVDNIVRAFEHMLRLESVDPERSGMGGFCVGASIAAVAAQDQRVRDHVKFLNFFGGYYDAVDLMKAVASGSRFYGEESEPWAPDKLAVEVVTNHVLLAVQDAEERALLARRFLDGDEGAVVDRDLLSPEGRAAYDVLSGPTLAETDGLLGALPPAFRSSMQAVSPSVNVGSLKARVLIMHDREDPLIPSEESRRLADALVRQGSDVYHTEFSFFQHVDPTRNVSKPTFVRESYKLFLHLYNVLRTAD